MIDTGLAGRVVLVTGANHGIGAAAALAFAAQGAKLLVGYLGPPAPDEVLRAIRDRGCEAEAWETDLAEPATIPALFDRAEATLGPADVLVNNAAAWQGDTFDPRPGTTDWGGRSTSFVTAESHDHHFAVNSRAVALIMAEFARRHAARGARWGRIINVSTDGSPGFPGEVSYGASKHALESYSRAAASELAPFGITVNVVSPGATDTGWIRRKWSRESSARCPSAASASPPTSPTSSSSSPRTRLAG